jgi:hypothetical protein
MFPGRTELLRMVAMKLRASLKFGFIIGCTLLFAILLYGGLSFRATHRFNVQQFEQRSRLLELWNAIEDCKRQLGHWPSSPGELNECGFDANNLLGPLLQSGESLIVNWECMGDPSCCAIRSPDLIVPVYYKILHPFSRTRDPDSYHLSGTGVMM